MGRDLKIYNETVYVVYQNGKPYTASGVGIVYTEEWIAKGTITKESKKVAEERYNKQHAKEFKDWYDASEQVKEEYIASAKSEFEIKEYGPKI